MSIKNRYNWKDGPAIIEQHSMAKHSVLESYLIAYFKTLATSHNRDEIKLTLVDGFAGGGIYHHADSNEIVKGSPFICIESAIQAEIEINELRNKKIRFDISHIFIEPNRYAFNHLKTSLKNHGYDQFIDKNVFLQQSTFQDSVDSTISYIKKKNPRNGRSIFILDQFGYKDVPLNTVQSIFSSLPSAEVILTFGVDSFLNFANDESQVTEQLMKNIGLNPCWEGKKLDDIKASDKDWRLLIQSTLYRDIVEKSGALYYTPFFIRNKRGHGDYWLIHLSQHPRARDVMTEVHWKNQNYFIHYGGAGLDMLKMLGYDPEHDNKYKGQSELGFEFDDIAKNASIEALASDLPRIIHADEDGLSLSEMYARTCNTTPASLKIYKDSLRALFDAKEIDIIDSNGKTKRGAKQLTGSDIIIPARQWKLF